MFIPCIGHKNPLLEYWAQSQAFTVVCLKWSTFTSSSFPSISTCFRWGKKKTLRFSLRGAMKFSSTAVHFESQILWFHLSFFFLSLWWTNPQHSRLKYKQRKYNSEINTVWVLGTGAFHGQVPRCSSKSPHCSLNWGVDFTHLLLNILLDTFSIPHQRENGRIAVMRGQSWPCGVLIPCQSQQWSEKNRVFNTH